jgi:hypothetical protein
MRDKEQEAKDTKAGKRIPGFRDLTPDSVAKSEAKK